MARKLSWTLISVFIGVAVGIWLSRGSWQKTREIQRDTAASVAKMDAATAKQAELAGKKARFESPIGREELARERGYRKPNETALENGR